MKTLSFLLYFSFTSFLALSQELTAKEIDTTKNLIYSVVEEDAQFPGGQKALGQYLADNINMHEVIGCVSEEFYSKVFVQFVINKDGCVEQAEIHKSTAYCPPCNKEALRLVESMPKWTPGIVNGQAVSMYFRLPIIFSVQ
ncbi:MAG: energy transducer TonB [Crocinitomicaceae bacterium]